MTTAANRRRAQDARDTLSHFTIELDGLDVAIIDQLTNLMHLANQHMLCFPELAAIAETHFNAEERTS
jgi:hypothetical protein